MATLDGRGIRIDTGRLDDLGATMCRARCTGIGIALILTEQEVASLREMQET